MSDGSDWQLYDGERARRDDNAPRFDPFASLHDRAVAPNEQDVDWKLPEARVNGATWREDERRRWRETLTPEQPSSPTRRTERGLQHRGHCRVRPVVAQDISISQATE